LSKKVFNCSCISLIVFALSFASIAYAENPPENGWSQANHAPLITMMASFFINRSCPGKSGLADHLEL
jgi:hypothetical protein